MIEPLLLTSPRVTTCLGGAVLTSASGFFFQRKDRLFLVTSRHVFLDESAGHAPDRVEITLHTDPNDLGSSTGYSIPLYSNGMSMWRDATDHEGPVDVAVIAIDADALPETAYFSAFAPHNIQPPDHPVEIGSTLVMLGYPLGFLDTLHHLPVARQAGLASSFGLRFGGKGYFLIDARTHRGISGAPVVRKNDGVDAADPIGWRLLGIHSSRLDMGTRDPVQDETLGLNAVWYADVLMALTEPHD